MKRLCCALIVVMILVLVLGACSTAPSPAPAPAPAIKSTSAPAPAPTSAPAPAPATVKPQSWRLASSFAAGDPEELVLESFAKAIKEDTKGAIDIKVYPGDSIGYAGSAVVDAVDGGVLELAQIPLNGMVGSNPMVGIPHFAYFFGSNEFQAKVIPVFRPYVEKELAKRKGVMLAYWPHSVSHLFTKKPVKTIEDWKGLKLRAPLASQFKYFPTIGATPVSMAKGETYMALSTGTIDGLLYSIESAVEAKLYEVTKTCSMWGEGVITYAVWVNKDKFAGLPKEMQDTIKKRSAEAEVELWKKGFYSVDAVIANLKSKGVEFVPVSEAERDKIRAKAKPVWDEELNKCGPDGIAAMNAALAAMGRPPYKS